MEELPLLGTEMGTRIMSAKKSIESAISQQLVFGLVQCLAGGKGHLVCQYQTRSTRAAFSIVSQTCTSLFGLQCAQYICTPQTSFDDIILAVLPKDYTEDQSNDPYHRNPSLLFTKDGDSIGHHVQPIPSGPPIGKRASEST
eukprot:Ihof_evm1s104 gene=Ihof_evmTU1s104